MIYVLIDEYGEYSDYTLEILYASTSKEKLEDLMKSMQDKNERIDEVNNRLIPLEEEFSQKNRPIDLYRLRMNSSSWANLPNFKETSEYQEWTSSWDQFRNAEINFTKETLSKLLPEFNLTSFDYKHGACYGLSIREIEEIK